MNVQGGQLIQTNGNPIFPGTQFTGPITAGNIKDWDGGAGLAGLGSTGPGVLANVGYAKMVQIGRILQAGSPGQGPGAFLSPDLVIPAQSLVLAITVVALVPWVGTQTLGVGTGAQGSFFTPLSAVTPPQKVSISDAAVAAQLPNWVNVGPQDVQLLFTSDQAGAGVGLAIVEYIQGINAPTS